MTNKEWLLKHGQIRTCGCGSVMIVIPQQLEVDFKTYKILLTNFPVWTCTFCKKTTYSSIDYMEWIEEALTHYEQTGDPAYTRVDS